MIQRCVASCQKTLGSRKSRFPSVGARSGFSSACQVRPWSVLWVRHIFCSARQGPPTKPSLGIELIVFQKSTRGFSSPDWRPDVFFRSTTTEPPPMEVFLSPATESASGCQVTMSLDK